MSYTLIEQVNTQYAHIKFEGSFQGKTVVWDTHFFTLDGYSSVNNDKQKLTKQFINIQECNEGTMELTLALKISEINTPNIQKMMIMIKQYKKLAIGRHDYG